MWQSLKDVSPVTRLLVTPIVGVIYLATIGRFFWLDLFYGIGVAIGLPTFAVAIYWCFVLKACERFRGEWRKYCE